MSETRTITEFLVPGPAEGLAGLLDVPCPDFVAGEPLPLAWHWIYLLDRPHQAGLGEDGHPAHGGFPTPPAPGLRRMWAGGSIKTLGPLRVGDEATRRSRVADTVRKAGRSGPLTFVTVYHDIVQHGVVVIEERQDIVYRSVSTEEAPDTSAKDVSATAPAPTTDGWTIPVSPTLLFRFSALTYNSHRVHYDRRYAQRVEGYPGLVTHGPLQALAMAESGRAAGAPRPGRPATFKYRMTAPLFEHQGLIVRTDRDTTGWVTAVSDFSGRITSTGSIA